MIKPFTINFSNGQSAQAIRIANDHDLAAVTSSLGLQTSRFIFVLIGGAGGMSDEELARLYPFFLNSLAPLFDSCESIVLDGGTDSGIMNLIGKARREIGASFRLVGVVASGTIVLPEAKDTIPHSAKLEPNHTHFILVPGSEWGDESIWIDRVAGIISEQAVTILINGGDIARKDIELSIAAKRKVVIVTGSGRLADELAATSNEPLLLNIINLADDPEKIRQRLTQLMKGADDGTRRQKKIERKD
ncbi:MAG: hypothetical protein MUC94_17455 [bacterium]|jgi:hypothetical protein|nr:hypothetical protein [bacterium]